MNTVYILSTNGIDHSITYTSKVKAVETAQTYVWAAQKSNEGEHHISVRTQKTGKIVFEETVISPAAQAQALVNEYYSNLDRDAEEIIAELRAIDPAMTATYYDCTEDIEEVIAAALSRLGSTSEGESAPEGVTEPETAVQSDLYPVEEMNKDRAALATWERELIANAGSLPVLPSPVKCQDCLVNEATIFDMDAPSCGECEAKFSAMNEPAKTETVCVVQNYAGTVGVNHYHAPGCRDIQREAKRHGASEGMGMYSNSFSSVADILSHEYSDICENTAEMLSEANSDYAGIKIMPCLSLPLGFMDSRPLLFVNAEWTLGTLVEDDETSYEVPSHTRYPHGRKGPEDTTAETETFESGTRVISKITGKRGTVIQPYMTGVLPGVGVRMSAVTLEMDNGSQQSALIGDLMLNFKCEMQNGKAIHVAPCAEVTGENGACCALEDDGTDAGFIETMATMEYSLSVVVDEITGATVNLGWVTLTLNDAQKYSHQAIAEEYGRAHGSGTPRHGWDSIILVNAYNEL